MLLDHPQGLGEDGGLVAFREAGEDIEELTEQPIPVWITVNLSRGEDAGHAINFVCRKVKMCGELFYGGVIYLFTLDDSADSVGGHSGLPTNLSEASPVFYFSPKSVG